MSALGHERTFRDLLDDFVRASDQQHRKAQRFGGLKVDPEFKFYG
ncbi:MAG: hypothetical protein WB505_01760 [Pseudolabrys sp.]